MATERIGLDFFTKPLYPSHLKAHGESLYFIGKQADVQTNAYLSDIYRLDESGSPVALTCSHDVQDYALLEDGIVFSSLRDPKDREAASRGMPLTVYYILPYDGGEARPYCRIPRTVQQALWLAHGRALLLCTHDHALERLLLDHGGDMEKALAHKREQDEAVTCVDELPFWFNGKGFINKKRVALYLYAGGECRLLSDPHANVDNIILNEAGTQALCSLQAYEDMAPMENTLCLLDIESLRLTAVPGVPAGSVSGYAFCENDGILLLHRSPDNPHGMDANPHLYLHRDGQCTPLGKANGAYNYCNNIGSDVKQGDAPEALTPVPGGALFLCTLIHSTHLMRVDAHTGEYTQVTQQDGMVQECIPYRDGYAVIAMRENSLSEIYTVAPTGEEACISRLNRALVEAHEIVTPVQLSFENREGNTVYGWVMPPVGYVPGKVYPSILNIHGGPRMAYGAVFFHEMQYWCAQGYAVLFCNPTGSDGRGDAFADIRGRYGTIDYEDIMQFVDTVLTRFGFVSASRMGVTGGSYGGYMTNWITGHTQRFRAAVSQRSIANWISYYATSDIGYHFCPEEMLATPWMHPDRLWKASPIQYANKVKTPTLFLHSEEDYRCNMVEGIQMFYALRALGVESRLCLFRGENHALSRSGKPKNRMRRLQEITRWMDRHLK